MRRSERPTRAPGLAARWFLTVAAAVTAGIFSLVPAKALPVGFCSNATFSLRVNPRKSVSVEVFSPAGTETVPRQTADPRMKARLSREACPCALVLHGAGGVLFDGPEMRRVARELAANGVRAYVVHYFDGSGVAFTTSTRVLSEHFAEWREVVESALAYTQRQQGTPLQRVGIYGYSMGAFLGIAASSDNPGVGALAEQAGGVWDNQMGRLGRMPPVLMIHGRTDRRVPFEKYAVPLAQALRARGTPVQTLFLDGEGHGFSPSAQAQARLAAALFIRGQLAPGKSTPPTGKPVRGTYLGAISP